jgi:DNA-binding IscR family transcriptional regulator
MKKQQAAQCKGAAGAVHGSRLTSEKGAGMPVQLNVLAAHYEISRANLTKSLQNFCCAGLIRLYSGGLADLRK